MIFAATRDQSQTRLTPRFSPLRGPLVVGFTSPSTIRDKQVRIDASANQLLGDMNAYAFEHAALFADFQAWYVRWKEFFDKYQGTSVAIWVDSDAVAEATDGYESDLKTFYGRFEKETGRSATGSPPSSVPWKWILGGAAALGVLGGVYWLGARRTGRRRR